MRFIILIGKDPASCLNLSDKFFQAFFDEDRVKTFRKFLHFNPAVGHRFNRKCKEDKAPASDSESQSDASADELCLMYEMKRKSLGWALLKHQMLAEMIDRNSTNGWTQFHRAGESADLRQFLGFR